MSLKLVKEVEETKCEDGARADASHWKPPGTKKLATAGGGWHPVVIA